MPLSVLRPATRTATARTADGRRTGAHPGTPNASPVTVMHGAAADGAGQGRTVPASEYFAAHDEVPDPRLAALGSKPRCCRDSMRGG